MYYIKLFSLVIKWSQLWHDKISDTILSTTSDIKAVKHIVNRVMVHKEMLSGRHLDKDSYFSNNMYGDIVTAFPLNNFHSCFKFVITCHTSCVILEPSTLSVPT